MKQCTHCNKPYQKGVSYTDGEMTSWFCDSLCLESYASLLLLSSWVYNTRKWMEQEIEPFFDHIRSLPSVDSHSVELLRKSISEKLHRVYGCAVDVSVVSENRLSDGRSALRVLVLGESDTSTLS